MRTSLLINCSKVEAHEVRTRAELQRRTVSGYVINIVIRRVELVEEIGLGRNFQPLYKLSRAKALQPRTTLHIYCTLEEANRTRRAARLERATISGFVLHCLENSWKVEESMSKTQKKKGPLQGRR